MSKPKRRPYLPEQEELFDSGFGECSVCGNPLFAKGGYAGLGMCGPCVTGEADTLGDEVEEVYNDRD